MRVTILIDNNTLIDRYFYGEPAVSIYIEDENTKVLFDVGYSDAFLLNGQKMDIDFRDLDFVVVSHGHLDHTWGMEHLIRLYTECMMEKITFKKPVIISCPGAFSRKTNQGIPDVGSLLYNHNLEKHFELKSSSDPVWITKNLLFLGEIPRLFDFEKIEPIGKTESKGKLKADYLLDDSALVGITPNGLVIIVGCGHAGICNIVEYAKKITGEDKVVDILGGFHLLNPSKNKLEKTIQYLKSLSLSKLHPGHCTDLKSKIEMASELPIEEYGVGLKIEY